MQPMSCRCYRARARELELTGSALPPHVYVFCCARAEQVKEHLKAAEWLQERASITVKVGGAIIHFMQPLATCGLLFSAGMATSMG